MTIPDEFCRYHAKVRTAAPVRVLIVPAAAKFKKIKF